MGFLVGIAVALGVPLLLLGSSEFLGPVTLVAIITTLFKIALLGFAPAVLLFTGLIFYTPFGKALDDYEKQRKELSN